VRPPFHGVFLFKAHANFFLILYSLNGDAAGWGGGGVLRTKRPSTVVHSDILEKFTLAHKHSE
jgi:hypothetical protein